MGCRAKGLNAKKHEREKSGETGKNEVEGRKVAAERPFSSATGLVSPTVYGGGVCIAPCVRRAPCPLPHRVSPQRVEKASPGLFFTGAWRRYFRLPAYKSRQTGRRSIFLRRAPLPLPFARDVRKGLAFPRFRFSSSK